MSTDGHRARSATFDEWHMRLHGHRVIYRLVGDGPPIVLVHGMINSSRHWRAVALRLAGRYTVIAPDLLGHGDSATPRGDYSLGAHATMVRDVLAVLGIDRATVVGHSLGGGVAMQFGYQFPQRVERLVLVSSGGLGREVSPLLRAAALPGARALVAALGARRVVGAIDRAGSRLRERGSDAGAPLLAVARALAPLERPGAREAFLQTLRAVIDVRGQRVSATDRLYMMGVVPTMLVWGERDRTIPVDHGRAAHAGIPGSRLELLERAAHFPHLEDPDGLAAAIDDFVQTTEPAELDDSWRELLVPRAAVERISAVARAG